MSAEEEYVFEICPLCRGAAGIVPRRLGFWRPTRARACPTCGALFVSGGKGRYRLRTCDPARLGAARGRRRPRSGCAECPPISECYLGKSLAQSDWENIGRGEPTDSERAYLEERSRMEAGNLPALTAERSPVPIEAGEQLHHVSTVYTCEQPLPAESRDEGKLVVTSHRIVLAHEDASFEIKFDEVDRLEKAYPGFLIYMKGSAQPFCFFPLRGDPVFYAIQAALRKSRGEQ